MVTKLQYLGFYHNVFSGSIPNWIGELTAMTNLDFSTNRLNGTIPQEIGGMANLHHLYLDSNQLTGKIPNMIGNLSDLLWCEMHMKLIQFLIQLVVCGIWVIYLYMETT